MNRRLSFLPLLALTASLVGLAGCADSSSFHLVVTQTAGADGGANHAQHVAPATFTGLTVTIQNVGKAPARGVRVRDVLPEGFRFYELTTLGGNAIRTSISDPAPSGDPEWGTWTIPAPQGSKQSALVLSFKVQVAIRPGEYKNAVRLSSPTDGTVDQGDAALIVVEPRPSLTITAAATTPQAKTGGVVTYLLSVSNAGSAPAKGVVVSAALPPGFLYATTTSIAGNSARITQEDPPANSLLPLWGAWTIPGQNGSTPGLLRITFDARILLGVLPGVYGLTTSLTGVNDIPAQTTGDSATVAVGKGTAIPVMLSVKATAAYAPLRGTVTYVITVENDSTDAARTVIITDSLPAGLSYLLTSGISLNGKPAASRLQPASGVQTPQWGPFTIPGGGLSGATLTITFTASVAADAGLGPHPNVVSGKSTNATMTGGADASPVIITAS